MEERDLDLFEYDGIKLTRKSLEIKIEKWKQKTHINRLLKPKRGE